MRGTYKPNAKRKHRVYVDVTYSSAVTHGDAVKGLQELFDSRLDLARAPVWGYLNSPYCDKIVVVERRGGEATTEDDE